MEGELCEFYVTRVKTSCNISFTLIIVSLLCFEQFICYSIPISILTDVRQEVWSAAEQCDGLHAAR